MCAGGPGTAGQLHRISFTRTGAAHKVQIVEMWEIYRGKNMKFRSKNTESWNFGPKIEKWPEKSE